MIKKLLVSCLLAFLGQSLATAQNLAWAKQIGGSTGDYATCTTIDADGNIYTCGHFTKTTDFDPGPGVFTLSPSYNTDDVFIQKLDAEGNFKWAFNLFDSDGISIRGISADQAGNIYVTGYFYGQIDFDPGTEQHTLTSLGSSGRFDVFIVKYNSAGSHVWSKQLGSTEHDKGWSVKVDPAGNVYTVGEFQGTVDFDPGNGLVQLTSAGSEDIFIQKMTAAGKFVWAKRIGYWYTDVASSVDLDANGFLYVTGKYKGNVDFDPGPGVATLNNTNDWDAFILKMDTSGQFVWANRMGSVQDDQGLDITTDVNGNVLVTGEFESTSHYGNTYNTISRLDAFGATDVFVLKVDKNGNFLWVKQMGGLYTEQGTAITTDLNGNVYTAGNFRESGDYDPGTGVFGLKSAGIGDIFIQKLTPEGQLIWATQSGGTADDKVVGLELDPDGLILTVGSFSATVDFDPGGGITNLTSAGQNDIFIRKTDYAWNFRGKLFQDFNANQVQDAGEPGIPGIILRAQHSNRYASTDTAGRYNIYSDLRGDTLRVVRPRPYWIITPPLGIPDSAQTPMNFAMTIPANVVDIGVTVVALTPFRPGFVRDVQIQVTNHGGMPVDSFYLYFDVLQQLPELEYIGAVPTPVYAVGDSVGWFIPHLGVSQVATFLLHLKTPVTVPLGKVLYLSGRVPLNGDVYTTNNTARGTVRVLGSFDPNDKQVTPERVTDVQVDTSELTYVIRFQNTGNFPADFVVILDTLPKTLDLSTFHVWSASHPFTWRLHEGRLLEVRFDDIFLPDSTSNEPGSHGFVAFSVFPEKGLTVGDSIPNRAGIYFDYNPPVITNTSVMRVTMVSAVRELLQNNRISFDLYPNPVSRTGVVSIALPEPVTTQANIGLFTLQGQRLSTAEMPIGQQNLSLPNVAPGTYLVVVRMGTEFGARLLVVQ